MSDMLSSTTRIHLIPLNRPLSLSSRPSFSVSWKLTFLDLADPLDLLGSSLEIKPWARRAAYGPGKPAGASELP